MNARETSDAPKNDIANEIDNEIVKEIVIRAPAARVFDALSDPQKRLQWWRSEGRFEARQMQSDLRVGGAWSMRGTAHGGSTGERPFTIRGEYRTVDPPRILEFTWIADWHENEPQMVVRFDLTEKDGHTTLRLTHRGFAHPQTREQYQGWPWLLKMLQGYCEQKS